MENPPSVTIPLHKPGLMEMTSYLVQGLVVSVAISYFVETFAKDYVATVIPGALGYIILVAGVAPLIEEFMKVFPLMNRHAETERSIIKLGFLSGLGFGIAEFIVYVGFLNAPIAVRFPEMFFHAAITSVVAYGVAKHQFMKFYLLAVLLHFFNNILTFFGNLWLIGGVAVIVASYYLAWDSYSKSSDSFLE